MSSDFQEKARRLRNAVEPVAGVLSGRPPPAPGREGSFCSDLQ
jgi:hypothetical protein